MRSSCETSATAQLPSDKKKKSLPVKKLLEMERTERGADGGGLVVDCDKCGEKYPRAAGGGEGVTTIDSGIWQHLHNCCKDENNPNIVHAAAAAGGSQSPSEAILRPSTEAGFLCRLMLSYLENERGNWIAWVKPILRINCFCCHEDQKF